MAGINTITSIRKSRPRAVGVDGIEIFDTDCVLCTKNRIVTDGVFHCKYCGVMCENCASKHQKTPKRKGHWAMRFKTIVQAVSKAEFKSVRKCENHVHEELKGYCVDCGELYCSICMEEKHDKCSVETLESMSKNIAREKDMREGRVELEDLRQRTVKAKKDKQNEMKYLAKQADKFMENVLKVKEKINNMLDNMISVIVKDKNEFSQKEAGIIANHVQKCKDIEPLVHDARTKVNEAYHKGTNVDLWLGLTKLQRFITHFDNEISKVENDKCDVKFEFIPSASLAAMLKEPENVGKMRVTTSRVYGEEKEVVSKMVEPKKGRFRPPWMKKDDRELWDVSTNLKSGSSRKSLGRSIEILPPPQENNTSESVNDTSTLKIKKGRSGKQKHSYEDDQVPKLGSKMFGEIKKVKLSLLGTKLIDVPDETTQNCITGSTYLPNGRLVFVDYNNQNLKLFTSNFELISCKFVDDRPWDVTHCFSTVIAVSYPFVNTVDIVETNKEMTVEGQIKTDRKCHGVAFHSSERWLYIACGEGVQARLQAYSLDGFIRKCIIPLPGVLHEPCFLTMSPDCQKAFISDLDNGVVGFDTKTGDLICQYKDPKIKRYWDLTVDAGGRVLVLTTDPDCLYVIMGDHNGQLLSSFKGKEKVCSLCYDKSTSNLVVTRWKSDEVEAFRLMYP